MKSKALFQDNLISNVSDLKSQLIAKFSSESISDSFSSTALENYSKYLKSEILAPILSDRETRILIDAMFQNNLNVSLASKATFMHRNTLMYRIEKIKAKIGLDIRVFDDACIMKNILVIYEKYTNLT